MGMQGQSNVVRLKNSEDYTLCDLIRYIIIKLGNRIEGLKKLMKLLFLIQYEVKGFIHSHVVKYLFNNVPISRTEFYIWEFGPMSDDVYKVIEEDKSIISEIDEFGRVVLKLENVYEIKLPESVKRRVDEVLSKFGSKSGTQLEKYVLERVLKMDDVEKRDWLGTPVDLYYKAKNIKIEIRELD